MTAPHLIPVHNHHDHGDGSVPPAAAQRAAAVWLVFAVTVCALVVTGRAANYVRGFWLPVLGGVSLLVLVLALLVLWRGRGSWQSAGQRLAVVWLLMVPVGLVTVSAPSPLGASMLSGTTSGTTGNSVVRRVQTEKSSGITFPELKTGEVNELTLEELSDRFNFDDVSKLAGKQLSVTGFVSRNAVTGVEPDSGQTQGDAGTDGGFMLNRFKIYCCAADAIAYNARIVTDRDFPDDTWVTVTGELVAGSTQPVIKATAIEEIHQPKVPYL